MTIASRHRERAASAAAPRIDAGRLVMVPIAVLLLAADCFALAGSAGPAGQGALGQLRWLSLILVGAFYTLIVWCYLRRGPAVATTSSVLARVVAVVATGATLAFPLLGGGPAGTIRLAASDLLVAAGTAWSVWSLYYLGRNLSVIAQARGVADRGPYRIVRHPLYAGEIVCSLGLALLAGTIAALALWVAVVCMQVYRARREEAVLVQTLPGYRAYRARTAALLPGLF